jgi:SAM-dependent methyltransferase
MNDGHLELLSSPDWRHYLELEIVPWIVEHGDLRGDVLEIGPGPGLMTDFLLTRAQRLVAVEIDTELAAVLARRLEAVEVVSADATAMSFSPDRFSTVTACTMLHHVPSAHAQDALFDEVHRVLRPGGIFLGVDSLDSESLRAFHVDDTFVPLDAATLGRRLERGGFRDVAVEEWVAASRDGAKVRFVAAKAP